MTPQVISLSAAGSTAWIPVDYKQNPFNISLAIVLSNTPSLTCKVEYTLDDVFNTAITPTAFTVSGLSFITSNTVGSLTIPVKAIRLTIISWISGTVTLTALQGNINSKDGILEQDLLTIHEAEHTALGFSAEPYWTNRPSRLWPVANLPLSAYCADETHAYGIGSSGPVFIAVRLDNGTTSYSYNFGIDTFVQDVWLFDTIMLAIVGGPDLGGGVRQYQLYRSANKGVSWTSVLTMPSQSSYFLHPGICTAIIDGVQCLLAAEYNSNSSRTPGGTNDSLTVWKSLNDGITWDVQFTWNVGYHEIRHFHAVAQDPLTLKIFFCAGDDDESRIITWDGITESPAVPSVDNLNATPGWKAIGPEMKYRFVSIVFRGEYFWGAVDTFGASSGIWRGRCADLSDYTRVSTGYRYNSAAADNNGWYGFTAPNGDLYFCNQVTAVSTARQSLIYGSRDGENWYPVAQYRILANGINSIPRSFHVIPDGRIMMQADYATGRTEKQTIIMEQSAMDFIEDRPDVVSPVWFVDPVLGNDSTGTGDFQTPWKTVNKAITGNRITTGARVMITREGVFNEVAANLAWTSHATNPGEAGQIVCFSGVSRDGTVLNYITPTSGGPIWRPDATMPVELEHHTCRIALAGTVVSWAFTTTTSGEFRVKDAVLDAEDNGALSGSGIYFRGGVMKCIRSKLKAPLKKTGYVLFATQAAALPANSALQVTSSVMDGGIGSVKYGTTLAATITNLTALNYGGEGVITLSATATVKPSITSCAFANDFDEPGRDLAGLTWSGTEITYCAAEIYPVAYSAPFVSATNHLNVSLVYDSDGRPQSATSPLMRLGVTPVENLWDYDRRPILVPLAGALLAN